MGCGAKSTEDTHAFFNYPISPFFIRKKVCLKTTGNTVYIHSASETHLEYIVTNWQTFKFGSLKEKDLQMIGFVKPVCTFEMQISGLQKLFPGPSFKMQILRSKSYQKRKILAIPTNQLISAVPFLDQ